MQDEVEKLQLELGIPKEELDVGCSEDFSATSSQHYRSTTTSEDKELMEALSQLNLSASLKADIVSTLGLRKPYSSTGNSVETSSGSLDDARHVPQSDDDSYEIASEGSASPLGLAW